MLIKSVFLQIPKNVSVFSPIFVCNLVTLYQQESWQRAAGVLRTSSHLQRLLWWDQSSWRYFLRRVFPKGKFSSSQWLERGNGRRLAHGVWHTAEMVHISRIKGDFNISFSQLNADFIAFVSVMWDFLLPNWPLKSDNLITWNVTYESLTIFNKCVDLWKKCRVGEGVTSTRLRV